MSFYWENLIYFGLGPTRGEDGVLAITYLLQDFDAWLVANAPRLPLE